MARAFQRQAMRQFKRYLIFYWKLVSRPWEVILRMAKRMLTSKKRQYNRLICISAFLLVVEAMGVTSNVHEQELVIPTNVNSIENLELNLENLIFVVKHYEIKYPEIVIAQAILETGWFKSEQCTKNNNLFGLYNSKKKTYFKFEHWTESVKAYENTVQYRYTKGDYYAWLDKIGYAEDESYTCKLKGLVRKEKLKEKVNGEIEGLT